MFADLENQVGSGKQVTSLANAAASQHDLNSCDEVLSAENMVLEGLIWVDPSEHSKGQSDYHGRYQNIRDLVRTNVAHGGLSNCSAQ
jgi:hypothetical protein